MKQEPNQIFDKLKGQFGDAVLELKSVDPSDSFISIQPEKIIDICLYLRDEDTLLFDYLSCLSGVDNKTNLIVVYNLYSFKHGHKIALKVSLDKNSPLVPSVERVWKSANWHEREAWDMFGIKFEGHPNLIRILCPYDWEGFPLLKDYKTPEYYHGIKIPY